MRVEAARARAFRRTTRRAAGPTRSSRRAPSSRFACVVSADFTRSAKKPTVPMLRDREHERRGEHGELAGAPVAAEHPQRELQRPDERRAVAHVSAPRRRRACPRRERHLARAARRERVVVRDQHERRAALAVQAEHQVGDSRRRSRRRGCRSARRPSGASGRRRRRARSRRAAARRPRAASGSASCACRGRRGPSHSRAPAASPAPASSSGSITFSSAVSAGSSWNDWNTKPSSSLAQRGARVLVETGERAARRSAPRPSVGRSRPASKPEQRRLARARRTDDRDRCARRRCRT